MEKAGLPQDRIDELTKNVLWSCVVGKGVGFQFIHSNNQLQIPGEGEPGFVSVNNGVISTPDWVMDQMRETLIASGEKLVGDQLDAKILKAVESYIRRSEEEALGGREEAVRLVTAQLKDHCRSIGIGEWLDEELAA